MKKLNWSIGRLSFGVRSRTLTSLCHYPGADSPCHAGESLSRLGRVPPPCRMRTRMWSSCERRARWPPLKAYALWRKLWKNLSTIRGYSLSVPVWHGTSFFTFIILLQDCEVGGRFLVEDKDVNLKLGDVLSFIGHSTTHEVTKVIKGKRKTLTLFCSEKNKLLWVYSVY